MPGLTNLDDLLRNLEPVLGEEQFVFASVPETIGDPVCVFREREGFTLILRRAQAERLGMPFTFPCRMITLNVHSNLEAVGLLARITTALAARGIPVNAVSAYYHDHLFVPVARAAEALHEIRELASATGGSF